MAPRAEKGSREGCLGSVNDLSALYKYLFTGQESLLRTQGDCIPFGKNPGNTSTEPRENGGQGKGGLSKRRKWGKGMFPEIGTLGVCTLFRRCSFDMYHNEVCDPSPGLQNFPENALSHRSECRHAFSLPPVAIIITEKKSFKNEMVAGRRHAS